MNSALSLDYVSVLTAFHLNVSDRTKVNLIKVPLKKSTSLI